MVLYLFGCKIKIHFLFVSFIAVMLLFDKSGIIVWGIIAAFMHEIGHISGMILQKSKLKEICLGIFDVAIVDEKRANRDYKKDILILALGPLVNFVLCLIFYIAYFFTKSEFLKIPIAQNFFLGLFNIMPVESLDGGQILYVLLRLKHSQKKTEIIVQIISFVILLPLSGIGFYFLLKSKYNFSLLSSSCYLIAIILLKKNKFY